MFQFFINNAFGPLLTDLPLTLASLRDHSDPHAVEDQAALPHDQEGLGTTTGRFNEKSDIAQRNRTTVDPASPVSPEKSAAYTGGGGVGAEHDAEDYHEEGSDAQYGFTQPAATHPQRTVWIPADSLGIFREEEVANQAVGIDVSSNEARMDDKGTVTVTGPPPDYED